MGLTDISELNKAVRDTQAVMERNRSTFEMAYEAAESPLLNAARAMEDNSALQRMLKDVEKHRILIRSVEGPLAEMLNRYSGQAAGIQFFLIFEQGYG